MLVDLCKIGNYGCESEKTISQLVGRGIFLFYWVWHSQFSGFGTVSALGGSSAPASHPPGSSARLLSVHRLHIKHRPVNARRDIVRLAGDEEVIEEGEQVLEGGPLVRIAVPAVEHFSVDALRTVLGTRHPVPLLHLLNHFPILHALTTKTLFVAISLPITGIRCVAKREYFVQQNTVGPHIRFHREIAVLCCLRCCP